MPPPQHTACRRHWNPQAGNLTNQANLANLAN